MATVTMEFFGSQLQKALCDLGVPTRLLNCEETPCEYRFEFSRGAYTTTKLRKAIDYLNNRDGLNYEKHTNGGFTVIKQKDERDFVTFDDTAFAIGDKVKSIPNGKQKCYLCFGKGANGYLMANIEDCAHLLIGGATRSGKSCLLNSLIMQLLCCSNADLILIDPKEGVEFGIYSNDVHHRIRAIAENANSAIYWLKQAENIMQSRWSEMKSRGLLKYEGNRVIIIIDEFADLILERKDEIEPLIKRISAKGAAAGVHLILATQDPRVQVVTGVVKSNLPTKICLTTSNARHSMNIIDVGLGATLRGKGDALVQLNTTDGLKRVQCPHIERSEVMRIITHRKSN